MPSPTQRTLNALRKLGLRCGVVERFEHNNSVPHGLRKDLFNIIDIIAISESSGIIGVQSCGNSFSPHWKKLTQSRAEESADWLRSGGKLEIWAWRKLKTGWTPRVQAVTLSDLRS